MASIVDSYSESNYSADAQYLGYHVGNVGQSFTGDGRYLTSAKFYIKKGVGTPTTTLVAQLRPHSGTFGTSSLPADEFDPPLAESNALTVSGSSYSLVEFTFDGTYQMVNGTKYCIELHVKSYGNGGPSNNYSVGYDSSSPTHPGNMYEAYEAPNAYNSSGDLIFYVYGEGSSPSPSQSPSASSSRSPSPSPGAQIVSNYYFDAHIFGPVDGDNVWTSDANAFDGSTATTAYTDTAGTEDVRNLFGWGTNAPTSGGYISQVRVRFYQNGGWTSYTTITPLTGWWTWPQVNALRMMLYYRGVPDDSGFARVLNSSGGTLATISGMGGGGGHLLDMAKGEVEVTSYEGSSSISLSASPSISASASPSASSSRSVSPSSSSSRSQSPSASPSRSQSPSSSASSSVSTSASASPSSSISASVSPSSSTSRSPSNSTSASQSPSSSTSPSSSASSSVSPSASTSPSSSSSSSQSPSSSASASLSPSASSSSSQSPSSSISASLSPSSSSSLSDSPSSSESPSISPSASASASPSPVIDGPLDELSVYEQEDNLSVNTPIEDDISATEPFDDIVT